MSWEGAAVVLREADGLSQQEYVKTKRQMPRLVPRLHRQETSLNKNKKEKHKH